ncbi:hypothetical protein ACTI_41190 [Actinoplanes sp. OR16]|uniref:hypothetical protein n=1 Tax=Actinoplanes sp. OR16 TaxID=946334 RepID=UPI000F709C2E|nr:hypothetical protein [Actinoplanes sp. OR16]BBH67434.1 hypothetical protein ACTI_41190 [Actinoplanes sp. OR16]
MSDSSLLGGLSGVTCDQCGVAVLAGKRSAMQTSVQWPSGSCAVLLSSAAGRPPALVPTCGFLRDSIDRAAHEGRLDASYDS